MTEEDRVELGAIAMMFHVFDVVSVLAMRGKWKEFADASPEFAETVRVTAREALANARAAKRGGVHTSWDWLLNA